MNFAQLRDALLALAPLDKAHVVTVNQAEALFWQRSQVLGWLGRGLARAGEGLAGSHSSP